MEIIEITREARDDHKNFKLINYLDVLEFIETKTLNLSDYLEKITVELDFEQCEDKFGDKKWKRRTINNSPPYYDCTKDNPFLGFLYLKNDGKKFCLRINRKELSKLRRDNEINIFPNSYSGKIPQNKTHCCSWEYHSSYAKKIWFRSYPVFFTFLLVPSCVFIAVGIDAISYQHLENNLITVFMTIVTMPIVILGSNKWKMPK